MPAANPGDIRRLEMNLLVTFLISLNVIALVVVTVLYRRAQRRKRERRVEGPNSSYRSQYVEDVEARQRWEALDPSLLHEVNREEVERTLAKLRANSIRALSTQERAFLDRMVEAESRVRRTVRRQGPDQGTQGSSGPHPTPAAG